MADQLHDKNEVMSEEYNKDTDVIDVLYCDPCTDESIQVKAVYFCVDCDDYLCAECHQAHKRARSYKNHVLKDTDDIPESKPKTKRKSEKCQEHQKESINWYCKSHDKCLCLICKQVNHRNCTNVKPITDVSQDFLSSEKLKKVKDRLMQLLKAFDEKLLKITENTESVEGYYATAIEEVIRSISTTRNTDLERMKALEVTCETTMQTIRSVLKEIETLQESAEEDQAFVATRKAESQLQAYDERIASVENDSEITKYRYVCECRSNADGMIGKIVAMKDRRALIIDECNVNTSSETSDCWITGIERLSDNRLVIADFSNGKIKLVDMTSKTVISELKLNWIPWDLTRIDDNKIAVTTSYNKKIIFVSITDTLAAQNKIDKIEFNYCRGIVCINNTLIVSYGGPCQIQILNLDGTVKQVIEDKDARGTVLFGDVYYMAEGSDTNILYLSDHLNHKLSSMTLDGKVIASFTHEDLLTPRGITLGRDGRIFVCSYTTNKIFEISPDLSEGHVILDEKDGITKPYSIFFDGYKFYVGSYNNNSIQIFIL